MVSTTPLVDKRAAQEREEARLAAELEERDRRNRAIEEEKKRQEQVGGVVEVILIVQVSVVTNRNVPNPDWLFLSGFRRDDRGFSLSTRGGCREGEESKKGICSLPEAG